MTLRLTDKTRLVPLGATGLEGAAIAAATTGATASVSIVQVVVVAAVVTAVASGSYFTLIPVFGRINDQQSQLNLQSERLGSGNATLDDLANALNQTLETITGLLSRIDDLEAAKIEAEIADSQQQSQIDAIIQNEGSMMTTTEEVVVPALACSASGTGDQFNGRILLNTTGQLVQFVLEFENTTVNPSNTVIDNSGLVQMWCFYDTMMYSSAWQSILPINLYGLYGSHTRAFTTDQLNSLQTPAYPIGNSDTSRTFPLIPTEYGILFPAALETFMSNGSCTRTTVRARHMPPLEPKFL